MGVASFSSAPIFYLRPLPPPRPQTIRAGSPQQAGPQLLCPVGRYEDQMPQEGLWGGYPPHPPPNHQLSVHSFILWPNCEEALNPFSRRGLTRGKIPEACPPQILAVLGGPWQHTVDVEPESLICARESELVAGLLQKPHERCISPGGSRGETGLNYSSINPNIGISANPNVEISKKV